MKSFNQELKSALVAEIRKHREQDQVVQGTYGTYEEGKFRGCAVGCAIHSYLVAAGEDSIVVGNSEYHEKYEALFGIPKILAELQDIIHEGLSDESFPTWPERFMEAVPTETELSKIWARFTLWLLIDFLPKAETYEQRCAISNVTNLVRRHIENNIEMPIRDWPDAVRLAYNHANESLIANVAHGVAGTFVYRVNSRVIVDILMRSAANASSLEVKEQFYEKCAEKLIELLKAEGNERI